MSWDDWDIEQCWTELEHHGLRIVETHRGAIDDVLNRFVDRLSRLSIGRLSVGQFVVAGGLDKHLHQWRREAQGILHEEMVGGTVLHPITGETLRLNVWELTDLHVSTLMRFMTEYVSRYGKNADTIPAVLDEAKGLVSVTPSGKLFVHLATLERQDFDALRLPNIIDFIQLREWGLIETRDMPTENRVDEWLRPTAIAEDFFAGEIGLPKAVFELSGIFSPPVVDSNWVSWDDEDNELIFHDR
jgi:hypothetical protein